MAEGDKTEKPTAKRRRDERKKGNVLMSKDIVTVATLFATTSAIRLWSGQMISTVEEFYHYAMDLVSMGAADMITSNGEDIATQFIVSYLGVIAVPMLVTMLATIGITFAQTRGLFSFDAIKPKFSKLNPLEGIKNLFSLKSLVDAFKNLIKISVLLYIVYRFFMTRVLTYVRFFDMDPVVSGAELLDHVYTLIMQIGMAFLVIAGFDFIYQWWEYERKLKMSKQEIKDEYKLVEGDPKVKAKIKQKQMQMAQTRMMQQVPAADVIVRNPTHYAVALRYKSGIDPAPVILAMGEDELALRIIKVGENHGVPIVENVEVARALFAQGELNHIIPPTLFNAVAQIIVMVMGLNKTSPRKQENPGGLNHIQDGP